MNTGNSGAVFFLGTRAHYQVLNQPDRPYDVENGNPPQSEYRDSSSAHWPERDSQNNDVRNERWYNTPEVAVNDDKDTGVKRRAKRRPSETALCEDMKPAQLNANDNGTPKSKGRRLSLLGAIASLGRRKRRLQSHSACYLRRLETALTTCTYRESCRCFECQSRYFECDEDEYSSEDDEYEYAAQYYASQMVNMCQHDDDDEVFIDTAPGDNTSTDMLLDADEPKEKSTSSDTTSDATEPDANLEFEVAAGAQNLTDCTDRYALSIHRPKFLGEKSDRSDTFARTRKTVMEVKSGDRSDSSSVHNTRTIWTEDKITNRYALNLRGLSSVLHQEVILDDTKFVTEKEPSDRHCIPLIHNRPLTHTEVKSVCYSPDCLIHPSASLVRRCDSLTELSDVRRYSLADNQSDWLTTDASVKKPTIKPIRDSFLVSKSRSSLIPNPDPPPIPSADVRNRQSGRCRNFKIYEQSELETDFDRLAAFYTVDRHTREVWRDVGMTE